MIYPCKRRNTTYSIWHHWTHYNFWWSKSLAWLFVCQEQRVLWQRNL